MAGPGVISFTRTERYSSLVAEELKEMRDARVFSDFKICINEESIPCHRLVLSVHSAMMKKMLTSDMAEAAKMSVNLDHIDLDVMKVILDYMYVGQVSFRTEQLSDMIIACDYLRINMLKDLCVEQVLSILQPTNVILWLKLSHDLDLLDVKSLCLEIIVASFITISRQPAFIDLSLVNFQECLTHVQQSSQQQNDVLDAALKWVDRDCTERLDHLETLVDQIQLDLCSLQGILGAMKTYKTMIRTGTEALYDRLTTAAMEISSTMVKVPSKPTLTIIGGQIGEEVSRVCWKLNEDQEVVEMLRIPFDDLQRYHSVCETPSGFIISGGEGSKLCIMFNAETMKWSQLQDMTTSRRSHGSISLRGVLYALGGFIEGQDSKSVHSLVIDGGSWQEEADLPNCLRDPKVEELNRSIFLLNEDNGQLLHMDVDEKKWTRKASLPTKTYYGVSMTSHNGKLYVTDDTVFACYIPAMDTWVQGQKPTKRHAYGSLVHHDKKLLLLGGSLNKGTDEVEVFDFEDETWSVCNWKMPAPLDGHHALVLNILDELCQKKISPACGQ